MDRRRDRATGQSFLSYPARSGSMPGTSSYAASRGNGIGWCYIVNINEIYDSDATLDTLAADLNSAVDSTDW
jgi:hypothetical protein